MEVLLRREDSECVRIELGRDDDLGEHRGERLGECHGYGPVEGHDAAEGADRVALVSALYASTMSSAIATPHGLACLTMTAAGLLKRFTSRHAASVSYTLR